LKPVRFYFFLEILVLTLPGLEILARLKLALIAAVPHRWQQEKKGERSMSG